MRSGTADQSMFMRASLAALLSIVNAMKHQVTFDIPTRDLGKAESAGSGLYEAPGGESLPGVIPLGKLGRFVRVSGSAAMDSQRV